MIEPQEPVEPDETEYCAWQEQQAANGNTSPSACSVCAEYRYAIEEALHVLKIGRPCDVNMAKTWLKGALAGIKRKPNSR